jgi:hypothetical protein
LALVIVGGKRLIQGHYGIAKGTSATAPGTILQKDL